VSAAKPAFSQRTRRQSAEEFLNASLERDEKALIDLVDGYVAFLSQHLNYFVIIIWKILNYIGSKNINTFHNNIGR
jgi:hypothetical protein